MHRSEGEKLMHVKTQCSSQEAFSFFKSNLLVLGINPVILGSFFQFAAKLPCKYLSENHSKEPPNFCTVRIIFRVIACTGGYHYRGSLC